MMRFERTDSRNQHFIALVAELDKDLAIRDGDEHAFFAQFNKIDQLRYVVVVYDGEMPMACGAIKPYDENTMEIKRMFTAPVFRGRGIASSLLTELENWAKMLGYARCILETGIKQHEAIGLYHRNNYTLIPNYGQYTGVTSSVCFEKLLSE